MTVQSWEDNNLVDELIENICPVDYEKKSKLGQYYCYLQGKKHEFTSFLDGNFFANMCGVTLFAYQK